MYHCGNTGCQCTHAQGCEFGWIHGTEIDQKRTRTRDGQTVVTEHKYDVVWPCPNCFPEKAKVFANSRSRQELQENLRNRSTHTRQKAYEQAEEGKFQTL